jgi:predicted transcriptional regulator
MSVEELASSIRKTSKTVRNTVVEMCKTSLLERTGRGTYRITTIGMKELLDDLKAMLESEKNNHGGGY